MSAWVQALWYLHNLPESPSRSGVSSKCPPDCVSQPRGHPRVDRICPEAQQCTGLHELERTDAVLRRLTEEVFRKLERGRVQRRVLETQGDCDDGREEEGGRGADEGWGVKLWEDVVSI